MARLVLDSLRTAAGGTSVYASIAERLAFAGLDVLYLVTDDQLDARRRLGISESDPDVARVQRGPGSITVVGLAGAHAPQSPSARVLQETFQRVVERAGIAASGERLTFHDLRHTFASHWVMRGWDLYKLQKVLGHKSVQMTQRYAHLTPEAFNGLRGLLPGAVPGVGVGGDVVAMGGRR